MASLSAPLVDAPVRIAFGDVGDPRVLNAAAVLARSGEIVPVLVGGDVATAPSGVETVAGGADALTTLARYVAEGHASAGIAGSLSSSASVIRAGIKTLGTYGLVTGCFVMEVGDTYLTYADCSVVPEPTAEQLATIASLAADLHAACTSETPRVAMLSFSTNGSAQHPAVAKVREATQLVRLQRPDLLVDGEIQFDAAIDVTVGQRKVPGSAVAGQANVLVFPDLDAGNIAYKITERLGGAHALGSFVLNLTKPWVDLSRGCSTTDLISTARLVARLSTSSSKGHALL